MKKLLIIIKREYLQRVRTRGFIISSLLGPLIMVGFTVVPGLLITMQTGGATKIGVVDLTGKMYESVRESLLTSHDEEEYEGAQKSGAMPVEATPDREAQMRQVSKALGTRYEVEPVATGGRSIEDIKNDLNARVRKGELGVYLVLPEKILEEGRAEFYGRNVSDPITTAQLRNSLNRAVFEQRLREANIDQNRVRQLSKEIELETTKVSESGLERDSGGGFGLAMFIGLFIYMAILMYGQAILSSVVEEKTTRVAEVLFSSVKPFHLMLGKLLGVSLVAITQYAIWAVVFGLFVLYGVGMLAARGMDVPLPPVPPSLVIYMLLFFVVGFLMYATIYVLVAAMVTTEKEAGQMALPVILISILSIYMAFPVIRNPNSTFAFWVSIAPFLSPITMLVRIVTETPPFWQIALSLGIGLATVVLFVWIAARIYRVGMLMYGKSANIPEVMRWLKQS
ncbi:MAG TPA: ABC transporter permease [Pyrinomonadaceae bacterium]|jgi:ABC-2 type transport system permease protein|nr:ABC transporter permease [Pyrinomonadaceae bacterium]